jgi:hypothetical protein
MAQTKTIKIGKLTYTKTVTPGNPELKPAVVTADKSEIKQKEKAIPHKSLPKGMLPGPVGTGKYSRRIRRGGELIRLKRR